MNSFMRAQPGLCLCAAHLRPRFRAPTLLPPSPHTAVRKARKALGVEPSMKRVDTCAAEFEAGTPYMYSSYDGECECEADSNPKVLILGGGPNRIGQGIEFDYCCCHASFSLRDAGYETIMMNSNPETVSTDYDTSSRLYFEPLTVSMGLRGGRSGGSAAAGGTEHQASGCGAPWPGIAA